MQVLFGRKKVRQTVPTNFAEEVLDLEAELDIRPTLSVGKRLIELYSRAIEFYAPKQDPKYLHYQERLQSLLSRINDLGLLEDGKASRKRPKSSQPTRTLDVSNELNAERTLKSHNLSSNQLSKRLQVSFQTQQSYLSHRLVKRKAERLTESDRSGGTPRQCIEDKIEALMEQYVEDKARVKLELKEKFRQELEGVKDIGNEALEKRITENLEKRFQEVMEKKLDLLEKDKQMKLADLKRSFY